MKIKLFMFSTLIVFGFTANGFGGIQAAGNISAAKQEVRQYPKIEMKYGKSKIEQLEKESSQEKTLEVEVFEQEDGYMLKNSSPKYPVFYNCTEDNNIKYCVDENDKPVDGKIAQYDDFGRTVSIENFKKGYLNGLCSYFYQDGTPKERLYYKNGKRNGMYKLYYPQRNIMVSANYKDGLLEGMSDVYLSDNTLYGRMKYKKGKLEKGFCTKNGKKVDFSNDDLKSHPENVINSCGISI